MDDKAALEDILGGGREGYQAIRERYELRLRQYAAAYMPNKLAEDAVQKVFARLEKSIQSFNQKSPVSTELYQMTDYIVDEMALEYAHHGKPDERTLGCTILHKHYVTSLYRYVETYNLPQELTGKVVEKVFVELNQRILKIKKSSCLKIWLQKKADHIAGDYLLQRRLGKTIKNVPTDSIDDVVQDILVKFLNNKSFEHASSLFTWFTHIKNSAVSEYLRNRAKEDYPRQADNKDSSPKNGDNQTHEDDEAAQSRLYREEEIKATNPRTIRLDPHEEDDTDTPLFDPLLVEFFKRKSDQEEHKRDVEICLEQVKAKLEQEGSTDLLDCLQTLLSQMKGFSVQEISQEIGRTTAATKQFMLTCRKKLPQYPPLQECGGIFLKRCLEQVKAKLEGDNANDDILICLQAYLLKLQGKSTGEIANQLGQKSKETKGYLSECKEKLRQHPAIPKDCQKWLDYLK